MCLKITDREAASCTEFLCLYLYIFFLYAHYITLLGIRLGGTEPLGISTVTYVVLCHGAEWLGVFCDLPSTVLTVVLILVQLNEPGSTEDFKRSISGH